MTRRSYCDVSPKIARVTSGRARHPMQIGDWKQLAAQFER